MAKIELSSLNDSILYSPSKTLQLNTSKVSKNNEQIE